MTPHSKHNWYKFAESIEEINFSANGLTELEVKGKKICIGLHSREVFACTQKCPHAGGIFADGHMDAAGNLVCPVHRYKFNPKNGRNTSGEGYYLKTYSIELRADGLYIDLGENNLFG